MSYKTSTKKAEAKAAPYVAPPISLLAMLSYCRAHESDGEIEFLNEFIVPSCTKQLEDGETVSAYIAEIPNADGTPSTTLWSAHTDTMHAYTDPVRQYVRIDEKGSLYKDDKKCLGADDGAGCWLLLQMIDANVPGTYIFHRGEERGGIGSTAVAANYPEWLGTFTHAIAFDRRGTHSVITHQAAGRCCSEAFATQLSTLLTDDEYFLTNDDGGTFTDTANYTRLIPECTNVSIGYNSEHSKNETLDTAYLLWIRNRMIDVFGGMDAPVLLAERDPSVVESLYSGFGGYEGWNYGHDWKRGVEKEAAADELAPIDAEGVVNMRWREVVRWVELAAPEEVADLLYSMAEDIVYDMKKGDEK